MTIADPWSENARRGVAAQCTTARASRGRSSRPALSSALAFSASPPPWRRSDSSASKSRGVGSRHGYVAATPDLNGDGLDDALIAEWVLAQPEYQPGDRLTKGTVHEFVSLGNGREHRRNPPRELSGPADLHIKSATAGDIDNDGNVDLWVESTGGGNVDSHFLMNNGDGTFRVDTKRAPYELLHDPPPENWRHHSGHLVDLDNDGDLDLALGQMRDLAPSHINQSSIVLLNDGAGYYLSRVILPLPRFSQGFTAVPGLTHFHVNDDGFQDLLLLHQRNDDRPPDLVPWTGRYIQVLIQPRRLDLERRDAHLDRRSGLLETPGAVGRVPAARRRHARHARHQPRRGARTSY